MKKLLRSNSETDFHFEKKNIEILNNNLKILRDPIINKDYHHKKRLTKKITTKKVNDFVQELKNNTKTFTRSSISHFNNYTDNPSTFKANLLKVIMLNFSYEKYLRGGFTNQFNQTMQMLIFFKIKVENYKKNNKSQVLADDREVFKNMEDTLTGLESIFSQGSMDNSSFAKSETTNNNMSIFDQIDVLRTEFEIKIAHIDEQVMAKMKSSHKLYNVIHTFRAILNFLKSSLVLNSELYNVFLKATYYKMNNFLIAYLDNKNIWFNLYSNTNMSTFIERYLKLKSDYIQSDCCLNENKNESEHLPKFKKLKSTSMHCIQDNNNIPKEIYSKSGDLFSSGETEKMPTLEVEELYYFHKYFFKQLVQLVMNISFISMQSNDSLKIYESYSYFPMLNNHESDYIIPHKMNLNENFWKYLHLSEKYYCSEKSKNLSLHVKNFFNTKLVIWRYLYIKTIADSEKCRICEEKLPINEFFFHAKYCMEKKVYCKGLIDIKGKMKRCIDKLNQYKETQDEVEDINHKKVGKIAPFPGLIKGKRDRFKSKSEDKDFLNKCIEKMPEIPENPEKGDDILEEVNNKKIIQEFIKSDKSLEQLTNQHRFGIKKAIKRKSISEELELSMSNKGKREAADYIDYFIAVFKNEIKQTHKSYEKIPYKLKTLNISIHLLSKLIVDQTIINEKNEKLCEIYFELLYVLVSKEKVMEMLLFDNIEQDHIKSSSSSKLSNLNKKRFWLFKSDNLVSAMNKKKKVSLKSTNNMKDIFKTHTPKLKTRSLNSFKPDSPSKFRNRASFFKKLDLRFDKEEDKYKIDQNMLKFEDGTSARKLGKNRTNQNQIQSDEEEPNLGSGGLPGTIITQLNDAECTYPNIEKMYENEFESLVKKKISRNKILIENMNKNDNFMVDQNQSFDNFSERDQNHPHISIKDASELNLNFDSDTDEISKQLRNIEDQIANQGTNLNLTNNSINMFGSNNVNYNIMKPKSLLKDIMVNDSSCEISVQSDSSFTDEKPEDDDENSYFEEIDKKYDGESEGADRMISQTFSNGSEHTNTEEMQNIIKSFKKVEQIEKNQNLYNIDDPNPNNVNDYDSEGGNEDTIQIQQVRLSDFEIIVTLGKGAFGKVDLVKKITTGDIYALKTVEIRENNCKDLQKLLKKETVILNEISHECLVRCYYVFSDNTAYYYVMEFVGGGDLSSLLKKFNLNKNIVKIFIAEMVLAFDYLHDKKIYHRDVKPENILITQTGHFKLTDFGISEVAGLEYNPFVLSSEDWSIKEISRDLEKFLDQKDESQAEESTVLGTLPYMCPEIITMGKRIERGEGDYWSLGVILYFMFTRTFPFDGKDQTEIMDNITQCKVNWEKLKKNSIDKDLFNLIKGLLTVNNKDRLCSLKAIKEHNFLKGMYNYKIKDFNWDEIFKHATPLKKYAHDNIKSLNEVIKINTELKKSSKEKECAGDQEKDNDNDNEKENQPVKPKKKLTLPKFKKDKDKEKDKEKENQFSNKDKNNDKPKLTFQSIKVDNLYEKNTEVIRGILKKKTTFDFDVEEKKVEEDVDNTELTSKETNVSESITGANGVEGSIGEHLSNNKK